MLNKEEISEIIMAHVPEAIFPEGTQLPEVIVPAEKLFSLCERLKSDRILAFDYLISLTAVDNGSKFTVVYHLESTTYRHFIVLKSELADRENASVVSLTPLYAAAEFFEREVFDLFGIRFENHPNLKRLFLEADYGFPLRKDFRDEVNIIER